MFKSFHPAKGMPRDRTCNPSETIIDTGYRRLCSNCYARDKIISSLSGKERDIELIICDKCSDIKKQQIQARKKHLAYKRRKGCEEKEGQRGSSKDSGISAA